MSGNNESPQNQRDRFIKAARQLCADEDEAAFTAKLAQIARQKPKGNVPEMPEDATMPEAGR